MTDCENIALESFEEELRVLLLGLVPLQKMTQDIIQAMLESMENGVSYEQSQSNDSVNLLRLGIENFEFDVRKIKNKVLQSDLPDEGKIACLAAFVDIESAFTGIKQAFSSFPKTQLSSAPVTLH